MNLHEAFVRSVAESLSDDTLRLVYADWLEDHGDLGRAEFIRVQCEIAQLGKGDSRRLTLHERQANLLAVHRGEWLPPGWSFHAYPPEKWRRGFVSWVEKQGGRLTREDGASLAAVPTLESLSLTQTGVTDEEFRYLPLLPNLREFCLWGSEELTDASFARITTWPALDSLGLLAAGLADDGLAHLATCRRLHSLMIHDGLNSQSLTDDGLAHLAGMTNLAELTFSAPRVTGQGLAGLAELPHLRKLAVGGCGLTADALPPLTCCRGLVELDLNHYRNGGVGDRLFALLPQLTSLRILHAIRGDVTAEGYQVLAQLTELEELVIGGQAFADRELAHLLGLRRLRRLNLHCANCTWGSLSRLVALPSLRALDLNAFQLEDAGIVALRELQQLRWLNLGLRTTDAVFDAVADLPFLEELHFRSPFVTDAGLSQLKRLPRLRRISAETGRISKEFTWNRRAEWAPNLESLMLNGHIAGPTEWPSEGWRAY